MAKTDKKTETPANGNGAPVAAGTFDKIEAKRAILDGMEYKTLTELKTGLKNIRTGPLPDIPELMASIERQGLLNPLQIQPAEGGGFNIIGGFRRFQALQKLHEKHGDKWDVVDFSQIPVSVWIGGNDLFTKLQQVTDNLQRVDTAPEDLYLTIKDLLAPPYNLDIPEIGSHLGRTSNFVIDICKYGDKCDTETKKLVKDGRMTFAQAVQMLELAPEFQEKLKETAKATSNKTESKKKVKAAIDAATGKEEASPEKAGKKGGKEIEDRLMVVRGILADEKYHKHLKKEDVTNFKAYMAAFEWVLGTKNTLPIPAEAEAAFMADYTKKQETEKAQAEAVKLTKQADAAAVKAAEATKKAQEKAAAAQAAAKAAGAGAAA